ncbi:MAG: NADPH-dependent oxidoreductase [Alcaligenaceae bacterium]|nr:NADPH-dependent oxidoreductase [Alcaligenaceae bacterium SAGV5]MPS50798.1 NADPH-dependent oxidoreductase [Alcaligenaceae bacterium SAGV3]MPT56702.1 NADPH-dependent oxidoreductase [Alcaligenaceae bacterium]
MNHKPKLKTLIASTRPGRVGPLVGAWLQAIAEAQGDFSHEVVDIADLGLPLFDEPEHPRLQRYVHPHTKAWSRIIDDADALVFVTPEYNHAPPPSLVNALTYLSKEWGDKAAGIVSYGGISGGLRAAQALKLMLCALRMHIANDAVSISMVGEKIDDHGRLAPGPASHDAARRMLAEVGRLAVRTMRERS